MYNLKRNAELYLVEIESGLVVAKHKLNIYSDYSFVQTFNESSHANKTLHRPSNLHEGASIVEANPANFSFTSPIPDQVDYPKVLDLATSVINNTVPFFDLYFVLETKTYKLTKCVMESITFNLDRNSVLSISFSGTGSQLSTFVGSIPGTLISPSSNYTRIMRTSVTLGGTEFGTLAGIHIDITNTVSWQKAPTLHTAGEISYPTTYVLAGRQVSGSVTQFLTSDNDAQFTDTATSGNLIMSIYSETPQVTPLLQFNFPSVVFTRRIDTADIITRVYDFRLNSNTTIVKALYKGV